MSYNDIIFDIKFYTKRTFVSPDKILAQEKEKFLKSLPPPKNETIKRNS